MPIPSPTGTHSGSCVRSLISQDSKCAGACSTSRPAYASSAGTPSFWRAPFVAQKPLHRGRRPLPRERRLPRFERLQPL